MCAEPEYILNSGAWSLIGLVVGYALGRWKRREDEHHDDDHA